ncbi:MAG: family N-acetyltransferase [Bacteroidetes bacterium]|jgi:ribosomal protein S18 acetylase RimI-like enzyme|nr:family N-acetyltransferase [Bacteroidota bacterium]
MNKSDLTYKKAGLSDVNTIYALAEKIWRKHYRSIISLEQIDYMLNKMYSAESLSEQMQQGQQFTLVYSNNTPVGYISISTKDQRNYFLHKFYIETTEQSRGIGTYLLEYIINSLETPETIELTVNRKNYTAINFYFKNGFVIKEVADFDIGNGYFMNDFVMIKKVKKS